MRGCQCDHFSFVNRTGLVVPKACMSMGCMERTKRPKSATHTFVTGTHILAESISGVTGQYRPLITRFRAFLHTRVSTSSRLSVPYSPQRSRYLSTPMSQLHPMLHSVDRCRCVSVVFPFVGVTCIPECMSLVGPGRLNVSQASTSESYRQTIGMQYVM